METNSSRLHELYQRFLDRQCSPGEVNELIAFFKADGNELQELIRAELSKPVIATPEDQLVLDRVEHQLMFEIVQENADPLRQHLERETVRMRRRFFLPMAAAASVAILVMVAYFNRGAIYNRLSPVKIQVVTTLRGERKKVTLSDGTQIWLNPGSTLQYPEEFRGDTRELSLTGEAFFDVIHDKEHPFIVHSGGLNTQVLGTRFNVQAYAAYSTIEVTLVNGKLAVGRRSHNILIGPNEQVVLNKKDSSLKKRAMPDASVLLLRKEGKLVYHDVPLLKVASDFQLFFNVNIELDEQMSNCRLTGDFNSAESAEQALKQLAFLSNGTLVKTSQGYVLSGGRCQ